MENQKGTGKIKGKSVAYQMKAGGNGDININWPAGPTAPKRVLQLVE
jgi:hypothetical protein